MPLALEVTYMMRAVACKRHPSLFPPSLRERSAQLSSPSLILITLVLMDVLPTSTPVHHVYAVPLAAIRGHQISLGLDLLTIRWALGIKPLSSGRAARVLNL